MARLRYEQKMQRQAAVTAVKQECGHETLNGLHVVRRTLSPFSVSLVGRVDANIPTSYVPQLLSPKPLPLKLFVG